MNDKDLLSEDAVIGIAGAGGLGSNVASILVRCGIRSLVIADFDVVEPGNLNRQFYFRDQIGIPKVRALMENLSRIDPQVTINANICRVTPENASALFGRCDLVIEAFDDASQKQWFLEFMISAFPQIPLVCASGLEGSSVQRSGNLFICGDQQTESIAAAAAMDIAPKVLIIASLQAETALEILKSKGKYGNLPE